MKRSSLYIGIILLLIGCKKSEITQSVSSASANFSIHHEISTAQLLFDTILYTTPSGYEISTTRLEYYISDVKFKDASGITIHQDANAHYINGRNQQTINIHNILIKEYQQIELTLGIPPYLNEHGKIPNTSENVGMIWPINMGGGYHFLKFEGHFRKPNQTSSSGFAIHLGETGNEVIISVTIPLSTNEGNGNNFEINVNPLEWLTNPNDYDFELDANYTMGIPELMQKIQENGSTIVTTISQQ